MRILTLVLSLLIFNLNIQAQSKEEPKNNLNKTLEQLQITFPNLQYWGTNNNVVTDFPIKPRIIDPTSTQF